MMTIQGGPVVDCRYTWELACFSCEQGRLQGLRCCVVVKELDDRIRQPEDLLEPRLFCLSLAGDGVVDGVEEALRLLLACDWRAIGVLVDFGDDLDTG